MKHTLLFMAFLGIILTGNAQTIYDIQGQAEHSPYADQVVTTKGIVTAAYSNSYFIQDGDSAWTGLYIYDQTQQPALGDSINLTGTIVEYYDMTEMKEVSAYSVLSSGNQVPEPIEILTGNAGEPWESVFIKVNDASCTNTDLGFGEWEINDGSGTVVVNDFGVAYTPILGVSYAITGPLDYSFSFFKIEPRTQEDIIQNLSLYISKSPFVENISKTSFDILWETNDTANANISYGLTKDYELGTLSAESNNTEHSISLTDLDASTIYYAKAFSVNANHDTTPSHEGVYITQSESSGEIKNSFNVLNIPIPTKNANTNTIDTIIAYINRAENTLDIAIYDLTNHAPQSDSSNYRIIQAINNAYNKGVTIRLISDDSPTNAPLDSLNEYIPVLRGNTNGIMHNKFLIIDINDANKSWVLAGSTNWTYNNLYMDFNNVICIQDQALAKAYLIEFNEMWGSESIDPNVDNARFGNKKLDNTPHYFNINGISVESYFSPSDKTTSKMVQALDNAESSIQVAMMAFTEDKLGDALVAAHERGINTEAIIDYVEYSGSEFDKLIAAGVETYDYKNDDDSSWPDGTTLHHKFCVMDQDGNNPLVISGTHNWSASAESKNDENTLFIYDKTLADAYMSEYYLIKSILIPSSVNTTINNETLLVYPNPTNGQITVEHNTNEDYTIQILDISGKEIETIQSNKLKVNFTIKNSGLYFIRVSSETGTKTNKIIVQ